jgi:hypothetical protein
MPTDQEIEQKARELRRKSRRRSLPDTVGASDAALFAVQDEDLEWRNFESEARELLGK